MTAAAASPEPGKSRFALPSAYTILFILIVLVALLTWIIPAGVYDSNADGEPIPGTYHTVPANPQRIVIDSLMAPINGLYGIEGEDGSDQRLELRRAVRRHRRGALHPGHRRLPRRDDEDRRDPGRDRAASSSGCAVASAG